MSKNIKIFLHENLLSEYKNYVPLTLHKAQDFVPAHYTYINEACIECVFKGEYVQTFSTESNTYVFNDNITVTNIYNASVLPDTDGKYFGTHTGWGSSTSEIITNTGHFYGYNTYTGSFPVKYHDASEAIPEKYFMLNPQTGEKILINSNNDIVSTNAALNTYTGEFEYYDGINTNVQFNGNIYSLQLDLPIIYDITYNEAIEAKEETYTYISNNIEYTINGSYVNNTNGELTYIVNETNIYNCTPILDDFDIDDTIITLSNDSYDASSDDSNENTSPGNNSCNYKYTNKNGENIIIPSDNVKFTYTTSENVAYPITFTPGATDVSPADVVNDLSRLLGALYHTHNISYIDYNNVRYTWDALLNKVGSNYVSEAGKTLVSNIASTVIPNIQFKDSYSFIISVEGELITINIGKTEHINTQADNMLTDALGYLYYDNYNYKGVISVTDNTVYYQMIDSIADKYTYEKDGNIVNANKSDVKYRIIDGEATYYIELNEDVTYDVYIITEGITITAVYRKNGILQEVPIDNVINTITVTEDVIYPVNYVAANEAIPESYTINVHGNTVILENGISGINVHTNSLGNYVYITNEYGSSPIEVLYVDAVPAMPAHYTYTCDWENEYIRGERNVLTDKYKYTKNAKDINIDIPTDNTSILYCTITVNKPYRLNYHPAILATDAYFTYKDENNVDVLYKGTTDINMDDVISSAVYQYKYSTVNTTNKYIGKPVIYFFINDSGVTEELDYSSLLSLEKTFWLKKTNETDDDIRVFEKHLNYVYNENYYSDDEVEYGYIFSLPGMGEEFRVYKQTSASGDITYKYGNDLENEIPRNFYYRVNEVYWVKGTNVKATKCDPIIKLQANINDELIEVTKDRIEEGYYLESIGRIYMTNNFAGINILHNCISLYTIKSSTSDLNFVYPYTNQFTADIFINDILELTGINRGANSFYIDPSGKIIYIFNNVIDRDFWVNEGKNPVSDLIINTINVTVEKFKKINEADYYSDNNMYVKYTNNSISDIYKFADKLTLAEWEIEGKHDDSDLIVNHNHYNNDITPIITYNNWITENILSTPTNIVIVSEDNKLTFMTKIKSDLNEIADGKIITSGRTYYGIDPLKRK